MRAAGFLALTACMAPPMGIGSGARVKPPRPQAASPDWSTLEGSVGVGLAPHREVVQVEGALSHRFGPRFSLEYGAALTQLGIGSRSAIEAPPPDPLIARTTEQTPVTGTLLSIGLLPYVRPRWQLGPLSIALAGMAMIGGECGWAMAGAFVDAQVGLGGERWSIYAGSYGLGYMDTSGTSVHAAQARVGAELFADTLGVALEVFTGLDRIQLYQETEPAPVRVTGAGIKVRWSR